VLPNPGATASSVAAPLLALRPKDAAKALGIGQRKLWQLSHPRGPIPCIRVGNCVLYPVAALKQWLDDQASLSGLGDGEVAS